MCDIESVQNMLAMVIVKEGRKLKMWDPRALGLRISPRRQPELNWKLPEALGFRCENSTRPRQAGTAGHPALHRYSVYSISQMKELKPEELQVYTDIQAGWDFF